MLDRQVEVCTRELRSNDCIINISEIKARPFLRWAGGKSWLLKDINQFLPSAIQNYYEPFLGGAAIFFYIKQYCDIQGKIVLSDKNKELINCYIQVRDNVEKIIEIIQEYRNEKDVYYRIRAEIPKSNIEKACRFLYLNRTSFNGIYRVNLNGVYNVPYGFKKYKTLFDYGNLRKASKVIANAEILFQDFQRSAINLKKDDLIVLDPPYTVAHGNNGFIKYNQNIFAWRDQERLAKVIKQVIKKEANFILTNAAHPSIESLFGSFGLKHELSKYSVIGGRKAKREMKKEYVFHNTNYNRQESSE